MALDVAPIAKVAATFLEELEDEYGDEAELVTFVIVAELDLPDERNAVHTRGPDGVRVSTRTGLLARAVAITAEGDDL